MPTCFKFGGYSVYFWSNEDVERNTTRIPDNDLSRIQEAIILNRKMIVSQWYERFGYINFIDSSVSSQQLNIDH